MTPFERMRSAKKLPTIDPITTSIFQEENVVVASTTASRRSAKVVWDLPPGNRS
jgi:hypothetical protein